jgi:hypothetical protein
LDALVIGSWLLLDAFAAAEAVLSGLAAMMVSLGRE